MLLRSAMRYYRLWIYSCNGVLLVSVLVFVVVAACIWSDVRMRFVPLPLYHPTLIYGYVALLLQAGVLQAVGCVSAIRLNERWLNVYWLLMLVLLVGDVLVGIAWVFLFSSLTASLPPHLKFRLHNEYGSVPSATAQWDRLQSEHGCCGAQGAADYNATQWYADTWPHLIVDANDTAAAASTASNSSSSGLGQQLHPASSVFMGFRLVKKMPVPLSCCRVPFEGVAAMSTTATTTTTTTTTSSTTGTTNESSGTTTTTATAAATPTTTCATRGCSEPIRQWLQRSADQLFVLGYCVIAFLKLCFLGILRYEIREMIQKIRLLQGELQGLPDLATIGMPNSPNHVMPMMMDKANGNNNELEMKELTSSSQQLR